MELGLSTVIWGENYFSSLLKVLSQTAVYGIEVSKRLHSLLILNKQDTNFTLNSELSL